MKKALLFTCLLTSMSCIAHAQWASWNWQQCKLSAPFDQGYFLGIYFLPTNPLVGWVCGYNGQVLRTLDGGATWTGVIIPNAPQLESIIFLNSKIGYCSGTAQFKPGLGGVYRSSDGGISWQEITPIIQINGELQRAAVWGCHFISDRIGMVVGGGCGGELQTFFRTEDGGNSWSVFTANYPNSGLSHVKMLSAEGQCYASGSGTIWRSDDGGRHWKVVSSTGAEYWQENFKMFNRSICVATAGSSCYGGTDPVGDIRFSSDLGASWRTHLTGAAMFGTYVLNDSTAWSAGFNRSVMRTSDYGKSWTKYNCGIAAGSDFDDIFFINDTLGFVVGDGIYKTKRPNPSPDLRITGDTVFCDGGSVNLSLDGDFVDFSWFRDNIRIPEAENMRSIVAKQSGEYRVLASETFDCMSVSRTVSVRALPIQKLNLHASRSNNHLCNNDSLLLSIDGQYTSIRWSTGENTNSIVVRTAGWFFVQVTDTNGCSAADSIEISGGSLTKPEITQGAPTRFCEGDSLPLRAQPGFASYEWSTKQTTQSITVGSTGRYWLMVQDTFGCVWYSDTIDVTVDPNPLFIVNVPGGLFVFDSTHADAITCDSIYIQNLDRDTLILDKTRLFRNIEFSVPQAQLNLFIPPNEQRGLQVCYRPSELFEQRDTLDIGGYCHRVVMLVSAGVANDYRSASGCDVGLLATTTKINTRGLSVSPAYPNPARDQIQSVVLLSSGEHVVSATLENLLGQTVSVGQYREYSASAASAMYRTEVMVGTSYMEEGCYVLRIRTTVACDAQLIQIRH